MIHDAAIFKGPYWFIYVREDTEAATKQFSLVVTYQDIEKPCRLHFEIICDMASTFEPNEVYETIAAKLTREFPKLTKEEVIEVFTNLNIIDTARFYTDINDFLLQRIQYH